MRIVIATVQVPFVRGGAEILAEGLRECLLAEGHEVEIVTIPYKWYPPERILDHMLACRLLDLSESAEMAVDRVIALKFPAYLVPHPNKVLWILHQHRTAYDLWDHPLADLIHYPNGLAIRDAVRQADRQCIAETKAVFTISVTVSQRLRKYCGIASTPLYHPPQHAEKFYSATAENYLFFPSRLQRIKRQSLVLDALHLTRQPVRVYFDGTSGEGNYGQELQALAKRRGLEDRIEWMGQISEDDKRSLYAHALGVIFPPVDEDYGYVTLEAMLAAKPVITCTDSGGPLEFVRDRQTGLVADPTPESLATAMDFLWQQRTWAKSIGEAGFARYHELQISWRQVVERLLT